MHLDSGHGSGACMHTQEHIGGLLLLLLVFISNIIVVVAVVVNAVVSFNIVTLLSILLLF